MSNENVSASPVKKIVGEVVLDVFTMGLLLAAFGTMFYNGFIVQSRGFTVGILSAISVVGLLILFFIGTISCMMTKVQKHTLTLGFLIFAAVQMAALVCNWAVLACLLFKLFTVTSPTMRYAYLVTTTIMIVGYIVSIFSYSDGIIDTSAGEEDDEEVAAELSGDDEDDDDDDDDDDDEDDEEDEEEFPTEENELTEEEIHTFSE